MLPLNNENVRIGIVPNRPGMYILYNRNGNPIYVGHSAVLRHRLQSYYQKDNIKAVEDHNEKRWRDKAKFFSFQTMPRAVAMAKERQIKQKMPYNLK